MERQDHSQLHDSDRAYQLYLRFSDILHTGGGLSLFRGFLPYRMVRRIARHADPGVIRDSHGRQTVEQSPEPATRIDYRSDRDRRLGAALLAASETSWVCTIAGPFFLFLAAAVISYLILVEIVKTRLVRSLIL